VYCEEVVAAPHLLPLDCDDRRNTYFQYSRRELLFGSTQTSVGREEEKPSSCYYFSRNFHQKK